MASPITDRRLNLQVGVGVKAPVQCCATSPIALQGLITVDGYQTTEEDLTGYPTRVLATGQSDSTTNGIYDAASGAWSLSQDSNGPNDIQNGTLVFVTNGTDFANTLWYEDEPNPVEPGSTAQHWTQIFFT